MRSTFADFTLLVLFTERKIKLSEKDYDRCFDSVLALLEEANNEKFRLVPENNPEEL